MTTTIPVWMKALVETIKVRLPGPAKVYNLVGPADWMITDNVTTPNNLDASDNLKKDKREQFTLDLAAALALSKGEDLDLIQWRISILRNARLLDLRLIAKNPAPYAEQCRMAIYGVSAYCQNRLDGTATEEIRLAACAVAEKAFRIVEDERSSQLLSEKYSREAEHTGQARIHNQLEKAAYVALWATQAALNTARAEVVEAAIAGSDAAKNAEKVFSTSLMWEIEAAALLQSLKEASLNSVKIV